MSNISNNLRWHWQRIDDLSALQLYAILRARAEVFVVEQNCVYQDCDDYDHDAWHLTGWATTNTKPEIVAYLRVIDPGIKYPEVAFGRVLTTKAYRGTGVGRELTAEALERIATTYGKRPVRISAQQYLEKFYQSFGFTTVSAPYLEDDIPHLEMVRQ